MVIFHSPTSKGVGVGLSVVEAKAQARIPFVIIHRRSVDEGVAALKVGMLAQIQIHRKRCEPRLSIGGEGRDQILSAELEVPEGVIGELTGEREQSVIAAAEIAVELGIVKVGAQCRCAGSRSR